MKNIFIEHAGGAYVDMFKRLGYNIVYSPEQAAIICFTGGADVSPSIYGDRQHQYTRNDPYRDDKESRLFRYAIEHKIPMVGICRGGQFLNVMSGGRMYQHVENHCGNHEIIDVETGETILVSSTHHQMMLPSEDGCLIAYSNQMGSREWYDGEVFCKDIADQDIEVVYYPHTHSLCFQPHPEFTDKGLSRMTTYFHELIQKYLEV